MRVKPESIRRKGRNKAQQDKIVDLAGGSRENSKVFRRKNSARGCGIRREEEENFHALKSLAWDCALRWRPRVLWRGDWQAGRGTHRAEKSSGSKTARAEAQSFGRLPVQYAGGRTYEPAAACGRTEIFRASARSRSEVCGGAIEPGRCAPRATKIRSGAGGFDGGDRATAERSVRMVQTWAGAQRRR